MYTVRDATLADGRTVDVRVRDGRIDAVGEPLDAGEGSVIDADGRRLLPGMVDVHVHFREPGAAHKETWTTGSESAAAGGVTTVVDQPNTDPPTVDAAAFDEKADLAAASRVDWGLAGGVTDDWEPDTLFARPLAALGEVFLADSTGDMGIEESQFRVAATEAGARNVLLTVHAEDADHFDSSALEGATGTGRDADAARWSDYRPPEAEVAAVERALSVAEDTGARVHVAHTSTAEGVDLADAAGATCEVTPHHLFLSKGDATELGTYGRMNPPLREESERVALFERLVEGTVDVVATDHAPHTTAEKEAPLEDAPSGVPGVETALPLLLAAAEVGELTYERVRDVTAANPARIFGFDRKGKVEPGRDADLVLVDPDAVTQIDADRLHSKCGWTPFEGFAAVFPEWTTVRGEVVYASADADLPADLDPDPDADGERFAGSVGENVRAE